jgi:hypothetical protein
MCRYIQTDDLSLVIEMCWSYNHYFKIETVRCRANHVSADDDLIKEIVTVIYRI